METLAVIIPILTVLPVVLIVLSILMPWFVYRISTSTRQKRDCLMVANKNLDLANQHLAVIAANTQSG